MNSRHMQMFLWKFFYYHLLFIPEVNDEHSRCEDNKSDDQNRQYYLKPGHQVAAFHIFSFAKTDSHEK